MKTACAFALCLCYFYSFSQGNTVLDLSAKDAYADFGGSKRLKPTDELTFGCWAYHSNWQSVHNKPTLMGNTQHVGYCLSLVEDRVRGWISIDSVYELVEYPTS